MYYFSEGVTGAYECVSIGYTGNHYTPLEAQFYYESKAILKNTFSHWHDSIHM